MKRPTLLLVHPVLSPIGGAEAVATWAIESLKEQYATSVLTWVMPNFEALNQTFGTCLAENAATWITPREAARRLVELIPDATGSFQKKAWLMRMARGLAPRYEVLVSTASELDFGRPGIQYVHHPWMEHSYRAMVRYGPIRGWRTVPALARRIYRPWMAIAGFHFDSMLENRTLVNSAWSANRYREAYGREATIVHPPVAGSFVDRPWHERRDAFVAIGRFEPDKQHDRAIDIVATARNARPELELHVIGTAARTSAGVAYARALRARIEHERGWVHLHEDLSRAALLRLLSTVRYGLHPREDEHFGIAVAEMVRAGVVPFVHDSGGPLEIVEHPALRFRTADEAGDRIDRILSSPALLDEVRARLRARAASFTAERFGEELIAEVEAFRG